MCVQLNILHFSMYVLYNHLHLSDMFPDQISPNVPAMLSGQTDGGWCWGARGDRQVF